MAWSTVFDVLSTRASDRGRIGIFYAFKMPKKRIGDDVGDLKIRVYKKQKTFGGENDPPDTFYPSYYARI
jgi:hypothetical protein